MLKMVINAVSAKSGGAATYIENLTKGLSTLNRGNQYLFYVPSKRVKLLEGLGNNIKTVATDISYRSSWRRLLWDQITLRRIVHHQKTDVLLSSSDFGMMFPPCRQILMIRNQLFFSNFYLRRILPLKSRKFRFDFLLRRWLISLSVRSSDAVVTASQSMMKDLKRFISIPDHKAVVNHYGVPLERFTRHHSSVSEEAREDSDKLFQILYVSEYSDYKNLKTLLKAALILRKTGMAGFSLVTTADPNQFPEVEIVSREEDRALASHPLVYSLVKFTRPVPYDEIPKLYQQSDLFVFPSLAESFGHPLVEAMASGLPIIASDIPICREICGEAAVYFSPLDPEDFAQKILALWKNPDLRERLGKIGRTRAQTHFDWKDHVQRIIKTMEQVARHARG
jgi:glycosyltransferase involved in cell wall biosynthesis